MGLRRPFVLFRYAMEINGNGMYQKKKNWLCLMNIN